MSLFIVLIVVEWIKSWGAHVLQLSEEIGMKLKPSPNLTFTKVLELKLDEHIEVITRVSDVAAKEYAIELVGLLFCV